MYRMFLKELDGLDQRYTLYLYVHTQYLKLTRSFFQTDALIWEASPIGHLAHPILHLLIFIIKKASLRLKRIFDKMMDIFLTLSFQYHVIYKKKSEWVYQDVLLVFTIRSIELGGMCCRERRDGASFIGRYFSLLFVWFYFKYLIYHSQIVLV